MSKISKSLKLLFSFYRDTNVIKNKNPKSKIERNWESNVQTRLFQNIRKYWPLRGHDTKAVRIMIYENFSIISCFWYRWISIYIAHFSCRSDRIHRFCILKLYLHCLIITVLPYWRQLTMGVGLFECRNFENNEILINDGNEGQQWFGERIINVNSPEFDIYVHPRVGASLYCWCCWNIPMQ